MIASSTDPWSFGWTQLFTINGFAIAITIAVGGFRTFGRWKREKIEELKIEIAFEALALAHEAKHVFAMIRAPLAYQIEWAEMKSLDGETANDRDHRGSYYAVLNRLSQNSDFFQRLWHVQPKFMAVFGEDSEDIFNQFHMARGLIRDAARALTYELPIHPTIRSEKDFNQRVQFRGDLWGHQGADRVDDALKPFAKVSKNGVAP